MSELDALNGATFDGEGLLWAYDNGTWMAGIKNYKPQNSIGSFGVLERHLQTDESFVLVDGTCCLLVRRLDGSFGAALMKQGAMHTVPAGAWHATITKPGAKLAIIERSGTNMDNSEIMELEGQAKAAALKAIEAAGFGAA